MIMDYLFSNQPLNNSANMPIHYRWHLL